MHEPTAEPAELIVPRPPIHLWKYRCAFCADNGETVVSSWAWDPNVTLGCVPICDGCRIIAESYGDVRVVPLFNQRIYPGFRITV